MKQTNLTLQLYLLKKGWLKNKQSIYKDIRKKGTEGWADHIFENYILKNDIIGLQEIMKEIIEYQKMLNIGVSMTAFLNKK